MMFNHDHSITGSSINSMYSVASPSDAVIE